METEQMAAVTDRRHQPMGSMKPSRSSGLLKVERRATAHYPNHPMPRQVLQEFLDALPAEAMVSITQTMGGSQRDPEPTGYRMSASW
jgi:hypothetical protein